MSWTDLESIECIKKLRDIFKVKYFIETGTHMGINAKLHSKNFETVITCELNEEYYKKGRDNLRGIKNVIHLNESSPRFLKRTLNINIPIYYLDAHFYDRNLPKNKRFVLLDELKSLKGKKDCIIIIHDFDNNLGHITYDGQPLNFALLSKSLKNVNNNFKFYTN